MSLFAHGLRRGDGADIVGSSLILAGHPVGGIAEALQRCHPHVQHLLQLVTGFGLAGAWRQLGKPTRRRSLAFKALVFVPRSFHWYVAWSEPPHEITRESSDRNATPATPQR